MNKYYKIGHDTPEKKNKESQIFLSYSNEGCRDIRVGCMK